MPRVVEEVTAEDQRKVWTREEAHLLADLGFPNSNRLELIDGDLIDRMGKKRPHTVWLHRMLWWLQSVFGPEFVETESPTDVSPEDNPRSEPEPDLKVTRKSILDYNTNPAPEELRLIVEVADSTKNLDLRKKATLYARAGIVEYWVVNIPDNQLVVHRDPLNGLYTNVIAYRAHEEVAPLAAPDARFSMDRACNGSPN